MAELDRRYGPLDWRLPESFAIYWSVQGLNHVAQESLPLTTRPPDSGLIDVQSPLEMYVASL